MHVFDSPATLNEEAYALYREGKDSAAALIWARAREAARTLGDTAAAFKAGFWEADARRKAGELRRARSLLFSLLADVPGDAPAHEHWHARMADLLIQMEVRPELARLQRQLSDLESLAIRHVHSPSDLHLQRGGISYCRGDWAVALTHFSRGWQTYVDGGWAKHEFSSSALLCCLRLNRREEAESWWKHLSVTDQDSWNKGEMLKSTSLWLALEAGSLDAAQNCVENGCGHPVGELRGRLFLRGDALDPIHDPSDLTHPANKFALFERKESVHVRYYQVLALVDYRLACLRFTVGMPAVDDLYYRQPDFIPPSLKISDSNKPRQQLRSFRFTWHLLWRLAKRLDALLECDWRTKETVSRWNRAKAIATACNAPLTPYT